MDDSMYYPMSVFCIDDLEFGIAFVTVKEKTLNDLKSIAGSHGMELIFIGGANDGETINVSALSRKDEDSDIDINGFLTAIRKQNSWRPVHDTIEGFKIMIFYNKETLS